MHKSQRVVGLTFAVVVGAVLATVVALDRSAESLTMRDTSLSCVGTVEAVGAGVYSDNACGSRVVLSFSSSIKGVSAFSFDVVVVGSG